MAELYTIEDQTGKLSRQLPTGEIVKTTLANLTLGKVQGFSMGRLVMGDGSRGRKVGSIEDMRIVHIKEGQTYLFRKGDPRTFNDPSQAYGQPVVLYSQNVALPNGEHIPLAETIAAVRPSGAVVYVDTSRPQTKRYVKVVPELDPVTEKITNAPVNMALATPEELINNAIAGHLFKHAKQQIVGLFHSPANVDGIQFESFYDMALYIASQIASTITTGVMEDIVT